MPRLDTINPREYGPILLGDFAWMRRPRKDNPNPVDEPFDVWFARCLGQKLAEVGPTFRRSVKADGICTPVAVSYCRSYMDPAEEGPGRPTLHNGHHRWAVALDLGIELPVIFHSDREPLTWADSEDASRPDSYR